MADNKFQVEKFDGEDFVSWKIQMEAYLYQKDLDGPLLGLKPKDTESDPLKEAAWVRLDKKALGAIQLSLSKKTLFHIMKAKTTKEAMEILTNMYEKPSAFNQVYLLKRLVTMRLDKNSVAEHVNNFSRVLGQLESAGLKFEEKVQALLFLATLPDSYNTVIQAITGSVTDSTTLNDIVGGIMSEEMRRKTSGKSYPTPNALSAEGRGRSNARGKGNSRNHRSKSKTGNQKDECWHCHKTGHRRGQCDKKHQAESHAANVVSDISLDNLCLSAGIGNHRIVGLLIQELRFTAPLGEMHMMTM